MLALDVACGRGRNTLELLALGYRVVATDVAGAALRSLGDAAASSDGALMRVQSDLDHWCFAERAFDLVVQCDYLDRLLLPRIRASTAPGGHVLIDTFMLPAGGSDRFGPANPLFRLEPGELERHFADWDIVRLHRRNASETGAARAAILARKPHDRR